ncbi:mechanosensitive ion channel [bacterium]|nr:mechanosensitive ion channel [bacterium]MBU1989906.1 mechanosensitive ion channel [bacterium]
MKKIMLITAYSAIELFAESILDKSLLTIGGTSVSMMFVLKLLLIIAAGIALGWVYKHKLINSRRISKSLSVPTRTILANLGYYLIIFITFVIALNSAGLNLSSLAVVAGALSVGIGFGLQNIVSNFISGIILMFEQSVSVGDYVELENEVRGVVREIRLRATIITTNEQIDIIVPNSNFIQNTVTNLTLNDEVLRLRIPFGVAYGTTVKQVHECVLEEILSDASLPHKRDEPLQIPKLWMVAMNSSSVDFELVIWVEGINMQRRRTITSLYLIKIYELLYKHNISIPFPQLDVHLKEEARPITNR